MSIRIPQFLAIILTVLALVPGGAHLLEYCNKAKLEELDYMTVQQIYSGWAFAGIVIIAAIAANIWLAIRSRSQRLPFAFACAAAALIAATRTRRRSSGRSCPTISRRSARSGSAPTRSMRC